MTQEQLAAMMEDQGLSSLLDEEVHAVKSNEATDINNAGPDSQISCLLAAGYDLDTIWSKVMDDEPEIDKPKITANTVIHLTAKGMQATDPPTVSKTMAEIRINKLASFLAENCDSLCCDNDDERRTIASQIVNKFLSADRHQNKEIMQKVLDVARSKHQSEGDIEIDDDARPSVGDPTDGLYVSAWVWVYLHELPGVEKEDLEEMRNG